MKHLTTYKLFENTNTIEDDIYHILTIDAWSKISVDVYICDNGSSGDGIYVSTELDSVDFDFNGFHKDYIDSIKHLIDYMKEAGYPRYDISTYNIESGKYAGRWMWGTGTDKDDLDEFLTNGKNTGGINEIEFLFKK